MWLLAGARRTLAKRARHLSTGGTITVAQLPSYLLPRLGQKCQDRLKALLAFVFGIVLFRPPSWLPNRVCTLLSVSRVTTFNGTCAASHTRCRSSRWTFRICAATRSGSGRETSPKRWIGVATARLSVCPPAAVLVPESADDSAARSQCTPAPWPAPTDRAASPISAKIMIELPGAPGVISRHGGTRRGLASSAKLVS